MYKQSNVYKTSNVCLKLKLGSLRVTTVTMEKHYVLYILSIPVALVIQHAMRTRRIILSCMVSLAYVSTLSHKGQDC